MRSTTRIVMSSKARRGGMRLLTRLVHNLHPAWILSLILAICLWYYQCPLPLDTKEVGEEVNAAAGADHADVVSRRAAAVALANGTATTIGNHFCILQPTLSVEKSNGEPWTNAEAEQHIALRAFMRTFVNTVEAGEMTRFRFSIYYGHDSDDPVFGNPQLRDAFERRARAMLDTAGFEREKMKLVFSPMYGLHGRINAIWNFLAKDAYYDGCDYFFMSNDDMVFFTKGWVARSTDSLSGIGSIVPHKRPCRYLGIVRFKDEWASWATFTFHVSTRLHMEIFGGVYYPVPYNSAHNDYWIHFVYRGVDASKYRGEIRVRNRVDDVDYALAHEKDTKHIAPPRYKYDKIGNARKYILEGRARLAKWIAEHKNTDYCLPPL